MTKDEFIKQCLEMVNGPTAFNVQKSELNHWIYWEKILEGSAECGITTDRILSHNAPTIEQARHHLFIDIFMNGLKSRPESYILGEKSVK